MIFHDLVYASNPNDYFVKIDTELSENKHDSAKLRIIRDRETNKYNKSKEFIYLISAKYCEMFMCGKEYKQNTKYFPLAYELIKLNRHKYTFIDVLCNFNLALLLEQYSPNLSEEFLNNAIKIDEKEKKHFVLPHLYHIKGRLYYNRKDYNQASQYFKKALKIYESEGLPLFISSMHNNLGLVYGATNDYAMAIKEGEIALNILNGKKNLSKEEKEFIYICKENLGSYFFSIKNYEKAENLWTEQLNFYKEKKDIGSIYYISEKLYDLFLATNQLKKLDNLVLYLKNIDHINNTETKIIATKILYRYYKLKNDNKNIFHYADKLILLNNEYNIENKEKFSELSKILNATIIESINQKYNFELIGEKRKKYWLVVIIMLLSSISIYILISINGKRKRDKELYDKQSLIEKQNKIILEKDLQAQDEKIKNMHLNFNLKKETEKAILDKLKKIRKSKIVNAEEILKDLYLDINNLLQIGRKNYDITQDSSTENEQFITSISKRCPQLTRQELKFCIYFKLRLNSKEIALLEKMSEGTVRVYKTKIKTKLGLQKNENLNDFLENIKEE